MMAVQCLLKRFICETGQETRRGQPLLADDIFTGFLDREDGSFL
jgi:hypothetical protein